ncbi:MAG TPA: CRISPR-associated helicase Cas3' [Dehalococcoidia bacterium]|nr:CRISPR-associated helicase Cas3' [Dehalococcoidia bacterium]
MSAADRSEVNLSVFWAKLPRERGVAPAFHPLICHLLDVAAVAEHIWNKTLSPYAQYHLAAGLGMDDLDAARTWVAALAGLHDTGKGCPAFQQQPAAELLRGLYGGALFTLDGPEALPPRTPHGVVTAVTLGEILRDQCGIDGKVSRRLAQVVGGHHGFFPSMKERNELGRDRAKVFPVRVGNCAWEDVRVGVVRLIGDAVGLDSLPVPKRLEDAAIMALAEIACVADWIGSNTRFFPFLADPPPPAPPVLDAPAARAYLDRARENARRALHRLHWSGWRAAAQPISFRGLFPSIARPCDLQSRMEELAGTLAAQLPALVIVEAPMGEGKTEAALYAADRWGVAPGPSGAYVAMPTQATSNQMFSRVREFLERRFRGQTVTLQLLHGHSALSAELQAMLRDNPDDLVPNDVCDESLQSDAQTRQQADVIAGEWFTARKRGLLAPFGVGTVDQALLAVLPTKHQFVRLGALAGKVVIFDEVHAYDAYMSIILECLLTWLAALGSPVLLLSATLPRSRRDALLRAYARGLRLDLPKPIACEPYPRLSWITATGAGSAPIAASERSTRSLSVDFVDGAIPVDGGEFALGRALQTALEHGGCAAVVSNTVRRARDVYEALRPFFPAKDAGDGRPELELFHARFRFRERDALEKRTLLRFGRPEGEVEFEDGRREPVRRPHRAVLVATQVIEQSLDLDFDLMVSDMAPVDLLLQRSGREHRHPRPSRPPGLETPKLWICRPQGEREGVPVFEDGTRIIYDAHILLRSWLALRGRDQIAVPGDVEALIEAVYGRGEPPAELSDALRRAWTATRAAFDKDTAVAEFEAEQARIWPPFHDGSDLLDADRPERKEDSPDQPDAFQARTRLGDSPIMFIVLRPDEWDEYWRLPKARTPTIEQLRYLLERSVGLTNWRVKRHPDAFDLVPGASRSATLRGTRLARLDENNIAMPNGQEYRIRLDERMGVVVEDANGGSE